MGLFSMDVFSIWTSILEIGNAVLIILGGASVIARFTPTKKDDSIITSLTRILIHWLGSTKPETLEN